MRSAASLKSPPGERQHGLEEGLGVPGNGRTALFGEVAIGAQGWRQLGEPSAADEVSDTRPEGFLQVIRRPEVEREVECLLVEIQQIVRRHDVQ